MTRLAFLVDTSVLARLSQPAVRAAFEPLASAGRIGLCAPVTFEITMSARNAKDHEALLRGAAAFGRVATTDGDHERALEVQAKLAGKVRHRGISLVDLLVASIAESRELTVLHYDSDFELLANEMNFAHKWVVPRGSAD